MADAPPIYPDDAAVVAVGERFADLTLPKQEWTHAAHFAACLWMLAHRPDLNAERDMPDMIRRYNAATGGVNSAHAGYHETITLASIRAARAHLGESSPETPLNRVHATLMAEQCGTANWLFHYWSPEILMHPSARSTWVAPNLRPLPF
ncbi:hypothetical protein BH11PSE5_BH11PSE5_28550 [soil metagenome]